MPKVVSERGKPHLKHLYTTTNRPSRTVDPQLVAHRSLIRRPSTGRSSASNTVLSIVQRLPLELNIMILSLLAEDSTTTFSGSTNTERLCAFLSSTFPLNVSGVCRSWRSIALSNPKWWASPSLILKGLGPTSWPFKLVGQWLETCLAKADASDHMITGMVKFSGWYNPSATFFALLPLLDRMERWEDLEITFSEKHSVTSMLENEFGLSDEGDAWATGMHLGLERLTALRKLKLNGRIWTCLVGDELVGSSELFGPDMTPQLPSLTSITVLHLTNMSPSSCTAMICSAPNLEVLDLTTDQHSYDWTPRERIVAPKLRKLNFVMIGPLPTDNEYRQTHPFLNSLRCDALLDLTVKFDGDRSPPVSHIANFVLANTFQLQRLSLTYYPSTHMREYNTHCLLHILLRTPRLKSLTLRCGPPGEVLKYLGLVRLRNPGQSEARYENVLCPILDEIHIKGSRVHQDIYSRIVISRRTSVARTIGRVTFEDCQVGNENTFGGVENFVNLTMETLGNGFHYVNHLANHGLDLVFSSSIRP